MDEGDGAPLGGQKSHLPFWKENYHTQGVLLMEALSFRLNEKITVSTWLSISNELKTPSIS